MFGITMKRTEDRFRHEHDLLIDGMPDEWAPTLAHTHPFETPGHTHEATMGPAFKMARQDT